MLFRNKYLHFVWTDFNANFINYASRIAHIWQAKYICCCNYDKMDRLHIGIFCYHFYWNHHEYFLNSYCIVLFEYMKFSTWSKVKFHVWIIKQTILSSLKSECQAWIYCWKIRFIRCSLSHTHTKSSYIKFENMMFKHSRTKIYSN